MEKKKLQKLLNKSQTKIAVVILFRLLNYFLDAI